MAMEDLTSWSHFLARQAKAPPLIFLSGVRHRLKRGVYCPMHSHRAIEIVYHPVGRGVTRLKTIVSSTLRKATSWSTRPMRCTIR